MKQCALILLKINENTDFISAFKKIHAMNNVISCDATRGDIDIFLRIEDESIEKCTEFLNNKIKPLDEVKDYYFLPFTECPLPVEGDSPGNLVNSNMSVFSFILAEIEESKFDSVYPVLKTGENVAACEVLKGKYNVIMTVRGNQFVQIDKFIANQLINLDGVTKIKEYPIINIYEN